MNKKSRQYKRLLALIIISFIIALSSFIFTLLFSIFQIMVIPAAIHVLVYFIGVGAVVLTIFSTRAFIGVIDLINQLELENSYTLGNKTPFYNLDAFKNKAARISRKRRVSEFRHFIIAFTSSSIKITSNSSHNNMISSLNYYTSMFLESLFKSNKYKFSSKDNVYGFNRGIFLIYFFAKEEKEVTDLIEIITQNIFSIVQDRRIKVYAQPFFGIKEVQGDDNIVGSIEDAFIARTVSESNFETFTYFDPSFKKETTKDDIDDIEFAIANKEFVVYYQPKYSIKEKKFVSVEALARWNSSKYGFLTPGMFIDKAEAAGMISLIDNFIFEQSLKEISEQRRRGRRVLPVSINFSIYEFYSQGFINHVTSLLDKYNVPPHLVEIEITETTSQANQFLSISIIKKLKEIGIRVLMDDFGIGYSGIDNLRKIPFDAIKIDKSFSDLIVTDEKTRSIVKLIIELGHINNIEVIIEGVDDQKQVDILRRMKIDTIQGFYYSKPLPLDKYDEFLKKNAFESEDKK